MTVDFTKYIGVPFLDNGRTLERGCDCWGLARIIWRDEFGFSVPSNLGQYAVNDFNSMNVLVERDLPQWNEIKSGDERTGDGVLMRLAGIPVHVGIVVEKGVMIHTHRGINSVLEKYESPRWVNRVMGIYRHVD